MTDALATVLRRILIGESPAIRRVRETIVRVAATQIPVLIEGPTGAGKELVAQALHLASGRTGPIVAVNVCAIAETMFEDTLFGHVRGAFTGAQSDAPGLFAEAHRGTIFLDEITGLPTALQAKLLRVLETRHFRRVGGRGDESSDFRVISATNDDLGALEREGRFRSDLRHRLAKLTISVPPLAARMSDLPLLAEHLVREEGGGAVRLETEAMLRLADYDWPGNVRELRSVIECAVAMAEDGVIDRAIVVALLERSTPTASKANELVTLLERLEWDIEAAAVTLGVHRSTIYRRLQRVLPQRGGPARLLGDYPAARSLDRIAVRGAEY